MSDHGGVLLGEYHPWGTWAPGNSPQVSLSVYKQFLARGLAVCRLTGTLVLSGLCPQVPMLLGDLVELEAVGR